MTRLSVCLIMLCALIWFALIGQRDLFESTEGRYASNAAVMAGNGDWLTSHLNDFKNMEKPTLQAWGSPVASKFLGNHQSVTRLITGISGFLMALFAMFVALRLYGRKAGLYAFLMCISYLMVVILGHYLTLDMLLSTLIFTGIGCLLIAQSQRRHTQHVRNWMLLAWATLALATLSKGPIAMVPPATAVLVYSLWQRDWGIWPGLHTGKGLILFLFIIVSGFAVISQTNPEYASNLFDHQTLQHNGNDIHGGQSPVFYYLPFLVLGLCPWIWTSLRTLVNPAFRWRPVKTDGFHPERFMWVFVLTTVIIFSLTQSKLPAYILPVFPVIAILAGERMATQGFASSDRWFMLLAGLLAILVALNIGKLASASYPVAMWQSYAPWLLTAGMLYLAAAAFLTFRKDQHLFQVAVAAVLSLASANLIMTGSGALGEHHSDRIVVYTGTLQQLGRP